MIWTGDGKSVCCELGISWLSGTGIDFTVENTVDNVYIIARCIQTVYTYVFAAYGIVGFGQNSCCLVSIDVVFVQAVGEKNRLTKTQHVYNATYQ